MRWSNSELRESYEQDGFVVLPRLLARSETVALKEEIGHVLEGVRRREREAGRDPAVALRSGVFVGLAAHGEVFRRAVRDERLADVLEAILGPNVEFMSDKVVFKTAGTDFGTPWHQDWAYWKGSHKVSVWIPLDDATPENGCLKVLPGSHRAFATHDGDASDGVGFANRLRRESVDESRAVAAELEAGGAVFFHDLLLHASFPNAASTERFVWIPTYRDALAEDPPHPWPAATLVRGARR